MTSRQLALSHAWSVATAHGLVDASGHEGASAAVSVLELSVSVLEPSLSVLEPSVSVLESFRWPLWGAASADVDWMEHSMKIAANRAQWPGQSVDSV